MIRTNKEKLVMTSVMGLVTAPTRGGGYAIDREGRPFAVPGTGGISYNVKVGDPAFGWAGDHVEPCVSSASVNDQNRADAKNRAYNILSCIGNEARVVAGEAKGGKGVVTGLHGGIEHVIIDFPDDVLENLTIEDKILVKAFGLGLELLDYPGIKVFNMDPSLLEKLELQEEDGKLVVPVAKCVPAKLMGSGIGARDVLSGDYDITTTDKEELETYGLEQLRFGDLVALVDCDNLYGRSYRKGALSIGVVVHSDCFLAGHGPGLATLFAATDGTLGFREDARANIGEILQIGRFR